MADDIAQRLARVQERISKAAVRAGRSSSQITLVAVTKTFDAATVQRAVDAGARDLGENRVQEALTKIDSVRADGLRWHLIGHLQSNKAKHAVSSFDVIHSVDSLPLVERLERLSGETGRRPQVLVQVDLGNEPSKTGASEDSVSDIVEALNKAVHLDFKGLMTMPPYFDQPEQTRPYFVRLRELLVRLNQQLPPERKLTELSMGMSHDFEIAIEEGATIVRVGTAIFGARTAPGAATGADT
ncbi:MAG TPA: YggS family pyridoxal phosphate-dependent enzyme [Blastocatellia bacterium]|nr:YggS family pyridoxal phosphate-dependent enzyme [Blastocatellia bacterium]